MPSCSGCRKPITHKYLTALGGEWHPECFRCSGCQKPLAAEFLLEQGRPYHAECLVCSACRRPIGKTPLNRHQDRIYHHSCYLREFGQKCASCGDYLEGPILQSLGKTWHPQCFKCAQCQQPITGSKFMEKDQRAYHEACYHKQFTQACAICQKPLIKGGLQDAWGHTWCKEHQGKLPACFSCGRLICEALTQGGFRYQDGRNICKLCADSAIKEPAKAQVILREMRDSLKQLGLPLGDATTPLRLVDQKELLKYNLTPRREPLGMARHSQVIQSDGKILERNFEEILVLYGLPILHFRSVLIHELCHAWLFYNHYDALPSKVEEGLCTLMEFLYLSSVNSQESKVRIRMIQESKDPVYGQGFREAQQALTKKGLAGMFAFVKNHRTFPGRSLFQRLFS